MRWFKRNQKGFTLVELLVAIPIIGLLSAAMGAVLIQLLHSNNISHRMVAVRQVQAAGDRVSQDGLQAQHVTFGDNMTSPSWSLNFTWEANWTDEGGDYNSRTVSVTYTLVPADGLYELQRHEVAHIVHGTSLENRDVTTTVGNHLDASQMLCYWQDANRTTLTFKVVSVVGTKTEERTYNIVPRSRGS
jgi:prepilin-type N-terminal cleavage/methylation domain-containing protein